MGTKIVPSGEMSSELFGHNDHHYVWRKKGSLASQRTPSQVVAKWLKDNKVKVLAWPSQSPDLNPIENLGAELKKRVRARRPTNLTQLHQLCQEERAKIHPTSCGKLVEGYPKRLTQVKQFKGKATKY
ncbi:unnamed protein product [Oncorhynchus mykiss]|uniref:Tc1-like transposase DDE domain-containing protein n=1 Tax=Oncorhynchus mykiss TaxID=8022 RepID=A0A060XRM1_ONCMY|nr:unnamed protein product [Oncorhynchus mykiss]